MTTTPVVKAPKGFQPAALSSRKRVLRPMLRKQKIKTQERMETSGAIRLGLTVLVEIGGGVTGGEYGNQDESPGKSR